MNISVEDKFIIPPNKGSEMEETSTYVNGEKVEAENKMFA